MEKICELAKKYGLHIIEDCSQAHGSKLIKKCGTFGDSNLEFLPDKIITTGGEGGMLSTNILSLIKFGLLRIMANHMKK